LPLVRWARRERSNNKSSKLDFTGENLFQTTQDFIAFTQGLVSNFLTAQSSVAVAAQAAAAAPQFLEYSQLGVTQWLDTGNGMVFNSLFTPPAGATTQTVDPNSWFAAKTAIDQTIVPEQTSAPAYGYAHH
jgi:hypothetical protein